MSERKLKVGYECKTVKCMDGDGVMLVFRRHDGAWWPRALAPAECYRDGEFIAGGITTPEQSRFAALLNGVSFTIARECNNAGQLTCVVTVDDVAAAIQAEGFAVTADMLGRVPPMRALDRYRFPVHVTDSDIAVVDVWVVPMAIQCEPEPSAPKFQNGQTVCVPWAGEIVVTARNWDGKQWLYNGRMPGSGGCNGLPESMIAEAQPQAGPPAPKCKVNT